MHMKLPDKKFAPIAIFLVLTLIALVTVIVAQQNPTQEQVANTECTYSSSAVYDYVAMLGPNTIYGNRTSIGPNDGTLYTLLTQQINMTLNYSFVASLPSQTEITYSIEQNVQTATWQYPIIQTLPATSNQSQIEIQLPPFNRTEIETLKGHIEQETGTASATYSFQIVPTFIINANTSAGPIYQTFTPTLTLDIGQTDQGNTITINNLQQNQTGAIAETTGATHNEAIYERYTSYIFLAACVSGLGFSIYRYDKTHVSIVGFDIEKMMAPYKDLVIEAKEMPEFTEETPIITVKDIGELAKAAEVLAQPISHLHDGTEHSFWVFDSDIIYTYKISQKEPIQNAGPVPEEKPVLRDKTADSSRPTTG